MQFNILALTVAAMAAVASANDVVTVYACSTPTSGVAYPTAGPTGASTGGVYPTASGTSPPITNGASTKGVSALGLIVAGGVALFI